MERWKMLAREIIGTFKVFSVERFILKRPGREGDIEFYGVRTPDWVNIVPVTPEGRIVLIRQYRPGTEEITLEIPGGQVDSWEAPLEAAARELTEETGYESKKWEKLGMVKPNPAIQNNRCFTYLATGCIPSASTDFDEDEVIEVEVTSTDEVRRLLSQGTINHALVVCALQFYFNMLASSQ